MKTQRNVNVRYSYHPTRAWGMVAVVVAAIIVAACGAPEGRPTTEATKAGTGTGQAGPGKPVVVTTFYPLEYLAKRIGAERIVVSGLVPAGTEPHDWEPTPGDIVSINDADVFIYQGAGFEAWAERVVRDLPQGTPLVVEATAGLEVMEGEGHEEEGSSSGTPQNDRPSQEELDPHLWLDPSLYLREAQAIETALSQADPDGRSVYAANLVKLTADLNSLDADLKAGLAVCERRTIVTSHTAFSYFVKRYDLRQIPVSGISPEEEPSPARLREIIDTVKAEGATHIFFETLLNREVAETIAQETGAKTLVLNPIEGLTADEAGAGADYVSIMRQNLANLRLALGCK